MNLLFPRSILLRLGKESLRKCSLTPLRRRNDLPIDWIDFKFGDEVDVGEATLLHHEGDLLSPADVSRPLLLIDSSWRDLSRVLKGVRGVLHKRSLPDDLVTAYPRRSSTYKDPVNGLASIEALYAAWKLLGYSEESLLQGYYWREIFFELNPTMLPQDSQLGP